MTITIREPRPYNAITNVKCSGGGGGPGSICACGMASDAKYGPLSGVWAQVLPLGSSIPTSHPGTAQAGSYDASGYWAFTGANLLQNVPCVNNPSDNTAMFVVWVAYQGASQEESQGTNIAANCSSATNCDGSASPCQQVVGLSKGKLAQAGAGAGGRAQALFETAPRQYQVRGQGGRGPFATLLATSWVLTLRSGGCGCSARWVNEGDGVRLPRVELAPDGVVAGEWRLTLALNGHRARYTCPAADWQPLGPNFVALAEAADGLPETLIVFPV